MNNPFLNTLQLRLLYISSWVMIFIIQLLITVYYLGIPPAGGNFLMTILDSGTCNVLQAACILGLWHPVRYFGNLKSVPLFLLFHFTLFLISSVLWIGLSYYLMLYIILPGNILYTPYFITLLPGKIVAGLFIYIIFTLAYYLLLSKNELKAEKLKAEEMLTDPSPAPVEKLTRIVVKKNSEFHFIPVNQIRYIEANGDYVLIYTDSSKYLKDQTMKYWETHLPDDCFVRIHRSFIVNIEVIAKIELYEKEIYKVHLKNSETVLKASSSGYKLLKQKMRL